MKATLTLFERVKSGNVFKTLENRILLPSVSTLLSPIERLLFGLVFGTGKSSSLFILASAIHTIESNFLR